MVKPDDNYYKVTHNAHPEGLMIFNRNMTEARSSENLIKQREGEGALPDKNRRPLPPVIIV